MKKYRNALATRARALSLVSAVVVVVRFGSFLMPYLIREKKEFNKCNYIHLLEESEMMSLI